MRNNRVREIDKPAQNSADVEDTSSVNEDLAVVVVTYNSADVIAECLASVRDAVFEAGPVRVIVVDNASDDDTADIVRATAPEAELVRRPRNEGYAAGVNAGIAHAGNCDVLAMNADIRLLPGAIPALRRAAEHAGIVVPKLFDEAGQVHHSLRRAPSAGRSLAAAVLGGNRAGRMGLGETVADSARYDRPSDTDWATGAAWLITRRCVEAIGLLDERYFLYSEETEYMLRARDAGLGVRYEPAAVAVHLGGEVSTSPHLWSLMITNKVRLHRERRGRAAAFAMWLALLADEVGRLLLGGAVGRKLHRSATFALLTMRAWPRETTAGKPGYVCFAAQDWWYHNQAHSDFQLMRNVARHRRVLVVNSIGMRMPMPGRSTQFLRKVGRKLKSVAKIVRRPLPGEPNFYVMSPLPFPFYGRPWLRAINAVLVRTQVRVVCALLRMRAPVVVVTIPTAWDVARPMRRRALVANRSDRFSEFPESDRETMRGLELALVSAADHAIYSSHALLADEREHGYGVFLDHGVDVDHFRRRPDAEIQQDLAAIPGPRVGFFGALDDYLVDFDLLEKVASALPDVSLVLIGAASGDMDRFARYPNVHWLGFRPYQEIPAYGSGFDVALMPWQDNDWIRYANPIKLKEYLALGLPVVSTEFPEVDHYRDVVRVARDHDEFATQIKEALASDDPADAELRRRRVLASSWQAQAQRLMALVEGDEPACAE
jgi:GT2 family glycosyltransferase/glycosyltransferase involved in cell wall biosynthesis